MVTASNRDIDEEFTKTSRTLGITFVFIIEMTYQFFIIYQKNISFFSIFIYAVQYTI